MTLRLIVVLPEHIINEESDECSEGSLNSEDDDESDDSDHFNVSNIPKGSLQGNAYSTQFLEYCYNPFYVF